MQQLLVFLWNLLRAMLSYGPSFGGVLTLAQKAAETTKSVHEAMAELHPDKKAEEMAEHREYAGHIVQLYGVDAGYRSLQGLYQVAIYGILTWGLCRLAQAMLEVARTPISKKDSSQEKKG